MMNSKKYKLFKHWSTDSLINILLMAVVQEDTLFLLLYPNSHEGSIQQQYKIKGSSVNG
jgi:hypothetical protein